MKNILIIDDDAIIRYGLSQGLFIHSKGDYIIQTAKNGMEALELLGTMRIDIIITDLNMPVMDGYEFLKYKEERYPHIPAFIMTAYFTPEVTEKLIGLDILQIFEKPFNIKDLAGIISKKLEVKSASCVVA
jgi:two-component system response regulator YesN